MTAVPAATSAWRTGSGAVSDTVLARINKQYVALLSNLLHSVRLCF